MPSYDRIKQVPGTVNQRVNRVIASQTAVMI